MMHIFSNSFKMCWSFVYCLYISSAYAMMNSIKNKVINYLYLLCNDYMKKSAISSIVVLLVGFCNPSVCGGDKTSRLYNQPNWSSEIVFDWEIARTASTSDIFLWVIFVLDKTNLACIC